MKTKYKDLYGFLIVYFGDYREGKSDVNLLI